MKIEDHIYLYENETLFKFRVRLEHMDVVNALEKYINNQPQWDYSVLSKKQVLQEIDIPLKFFRNMGKYRLEDNLIKTENYLVPKKTTFLCILGNLYNDSILTRAYLSYLGGIKSEANITDDVLQNEIINELFQNISIDLINKYDISKEGLIDTIDNIKKLDSSSNSEIYDTLTIFKWILTSIEENEKNITKLDLKCKFKKLIDETKEKQKVK